MKLGSYGIRRIFPEVLLFSADETVLKTRTLTFFFATMNLKLPFLEVRAKFGFSAP